MTNHLRFSGATGQAQREALVAIIRAEPTLMRVLDTIRALALPDAWLVSGAIYNCVWNSLTGRPALHGVNDIDIIYFDADLSWEAEDRVIKALEQALDGLPVPVQPRNQARVHLWFPGKFGTPFAPLASSAEMLGRYASKTHAVGVRLEADDTLTVLAPFGLDDVFSFRITPNPVLANKKAHEAKAARALSIWPEITVLPWPDGA